MVLIESLLKLFWKKKICSESKRDFYGQTSDKIAFVVFAVIVSVKETNTSTISSDEIVYSCQHSYTCISVGSQGQTTVHMYTVGGITV